MNVVGTSPVVGTPAMVRASPVPRGVGESLDDEEEPLPQPGISDRSLSFRRQFVTCSYAIVGQTLAGLLTVREIHQNKQYGKIFHPYVVQYVPFFGDVGGALASALCMHFIGRKKSLIISSVLLLVPLLIFVLDMETFIDFLSIVVLHFAERYQAVVLYVYVAEITDPRWRAFFLGLCFCMFHGGMSVATCFPPKSKFIFLLDLILAIGSLVLALLAPETPYWLALTDRRDDAEELFIWLRGGTADNAESFLAFNKAEDDAPIKADGIVANVYTSNFLLPLTLVFFMHLVNSSIITGLFTKITFDLIRHYKYDFSLFIRPFIGRFSLALIFHTILPIVGCAIFMALSLVLGRRILYFTSEGLTLLLFSSFIVAKSKMTIPFLCFHASLLTTFMGGVQMPIILTTEIFPAIVRDLSVGSLEILMMLFHLLEIVTHKSLSDTLLLTFHSAIVSAGLVLSFLFMPETKNLTLLECEDLGNDVLIRVVFFPDTEETELLADPVPTVPVPTIPVQTIPVLIPTVRK